ncbi:hypothetical protein GTY77_18300 [Streptomyces sp. SID8380]|nr:hypothetical protein [Streptomyces sp. SID8380]
MDVTFHASEWAKALEQKATTPVDSLDHQILDTLIAFERTQAWMSIAREMIKSTDSHSRLVKALQNQDMNYAEANVLATTLLALGYAEATGTEITSDVFNKAFNISL